MQDTLSVAVRTFITITSLVAVPLVAVLGFSHPQTAQWLDHLRSGDGAPTATIAASRAASDDGAMGTADAEPATAGPAPPDGGGGADRAPPAGQGSDATLSTPPFWEGAQAAEDGGVGPARAEAPDSVSFDRGAPDDRLPHHEERAERSVDERGDRATTAADGEGGAITSDEGTVPGEAPEPFTALTQRLRELGATHYRLETWGSDGRLFRFRCLMAVPGRHRQTRYFEAVAEQPLDAMSQVLADVEPWHAQRVAARGADGRRSAERRQADADRVGGAPQRR